MKEPIIYIKNESGYADIRLHDSSSKTKQWCHDNGYLNSLTHFGKTWCGDPVWYPGMTEGRYKFVINPDDVEEFIELAEEIGLIIKSEF